MLRNYFLIALRNLWRNKVFSAINLLGLAVGLASCLVIVAFARKELSYDRFHEKADQVYRLNFFRSLPEEMHMAAVGPPTGPALQAAFPEVEAFVRFRPTENQLMRIGEEQFYEDDLYFADSGFFQVFSFALEKGNPETALSGANSVVLSQEMAEQYFPDQNPMGQNILMEGETPLTVTGVLAPIPQNSHLDFHFLVSFSTFKVPEGYPVDLQEWGWVAFPSYVLLKEDVDVAGLQEKASEWYGKQFREDRAMPFTLEFQPLTDIYLYSSGIRERQDMAANGDPRYLFGLLAIAGMILLIACFNFMNLTTARSAKRSLEVGIRKVIGARRSQLIRQFLGESILLAMLSLFLALVLVDLFADIMLPQLGWTVDFGFSDILSLLPAGLILVAIVGVLAGTYPAFFLSAFKPISVLKSSGVSTGGNRSGFRKFLVLGQFWISAFLIAATLLIRQQIDFLHAKELGYDKEQMLMVDLDGSVLSDRYGMIRETLMQLPEVTRVSAGGERFNGNQGSVPVIEVNKPESETHRISTFGVYYDFFETLNLELSQGRVHDRYRKEDSANFILNEAAVKMFAWEDGPIGKRVILNGSQEGEVIGVVKDFHFSSLREEISPLIMMVPRAHVDQFYVKLETDDLAGSLASLRSQWEKTVPDFPFQYTFLDEQIDRLYRAEQQFAGLVSAFSFLAILVACLGLYGLSAYTAETRAREISIRKVLGASTSHVLVLLLREHMILIGIALVLAIPVSWWAMNQWLANFAYQIEIKPGVFILTGGIALLVALGTLSYHSLQSALANPVDSLRGE